MWCIVSPGYWSNCVCAQLRQLGIHYFACYLFYFAGCSSIPHSLAERKKRYLKYLMAFKQLIIFHSRTSKNVFLQCNNVRIFLFFPYRYSLHNVVPRQGWQNNSTFFLHPRWYVVLSKICIIKVDVKTLFEKSCVSFLFNGSLGIIWKSLKYQL